MSICEVCFLSNDCGFRSAEDVDGNIPLKPQFCRHFVCLEGRKAGRRAIISSESTRLSVHVEDQQITGVVFGAGDKPAEKSGWIALNDGTIYTCNSKGVYKKSPQNIFTTT